MTGGGFNTNHLVYIGTIIDKRKGMEFSALVKDFIDANMPQGDLDDKDQTRARATLVQAEKIIQTWLDKSDNADDLKKNIPDVIKNLKEITRLSELGEGYPGAESLAQQTLELIVDKHIEGKAASIA